MIFGLRWGQPPGSPPTPSSALLWHCLTFCFISTIAALLPVAAVSQVSKPVPRFEDFRVPTPIPERKAKAEVANHKNGWEKQLIKDAKAGPDFAGHFVIRQFTCGSACSAFAIVDVKTGAFRYNPFNVAEAFCPENIAVGERLTYRLDSSLLIVNGRIENPANAEHPGTCGHHYYKWDGRSLKLIASITTARN